MERADADEFPTLFLAPRASHHINDVGPFLDGVDRAGVKECRHRTLRELVLNGSRGAVRRLARDLRGTDASTAEGNPRQSVTAAMARLRLLILCALSFSLMTVCVKHLGGALPVAEIVLVQSLISIAITLVMLRHVRVSPWGSGGDDCSCVACSAPPPCSVFLKRWPVCL